MVGAIDVRGASAAGGPGHPTYRYLVSAGLTEFGQVYDLGIPCPDEAMASNGDTIELGHQDTKDTMRKEVMSFVWRGVSVITRPA